MKAGIKTLTVRELETSNIGTVWVLNRTQGRDKGQVIFTVPKQNGNGVDSVMVPITFLPIDLTEQVSKKQLIESSEFRRAVRLNIISIIGEDDAQKLLSVRGADKELARLRLELETSMGTPSEVNNVMAPQINVESATASGEGDDNSAPRVDGVLGALLTLMSSLSDSDEVDVINSLRSLEDDMVAVDYNYVIQEASKAGSKRVIKFCESCLRKLAAAE